MSITWFNFGHRPVVTLLIYPINNLFSVSPLILLIKNVKMGNEIHNEQFRSAKSFVNPNNLVLKLHLFIILQYKYLVHDVEDS